MGCDQRDVQFTEFVAARSRALLGTAYLLTGDRQRGEDLLQTALLKTYLAWPRLRETRAVEAYVRRTMVTTNISWWRRRWQGELPTADLPDGHEDGPEDAFEQRSLLWPHLVALPPRQRTAVVLRFYEDLSEVQIAEQMSCSVGTVKSQTHRALATLRARLGQTESALHGGAR
jgi:RNA polymerase sigma-70 factor (ECF subfamily)